MPIGEIEAMGIFVDRRGSGAWAGEESIVLNTTNLTT